MTIRDDGGYQLKVSRNPEVRARCGFPTNSSLYRAMDVAGFPRPIKIGERGVAWIDEEIDGWLEARIAARDKAAAG